MVNFFLWVERKQCQQPNPVILVAYGHFLHSEYRAWIHLFCLFFQNIFDVLVECLKAFLRAHLRFGCFQCACLILLIRAHMFLSMLPDYLLDDLHFFFESRRNCWHGKSRKLPYLEVSDAFRVLTSTKKNQKGLLDTENRTKSDHKIVI